MSKIVGQKTMTQQCRLKDICTDTHWRDDLKRSWKKIAGTFPNRECLLTHQNKRLSLRLCGRYTNGSGKLLTQVDQKEPTPLLDQENSPCTLRECKPNLKIVQENKNVFESLISASATKQSPGMERSHVDILAWSHDVEDKAQKCVERCCELASKNNKQLD